MLSALRGGCRGDIYVVSTHKCMNALLSFQKRGFCKVHIVSSVYCKKRQIRQNIQLITKENSSFNAITIKKFLEKEENRAATLVLILDHIQDPQNLGAIFRSAALFSVDLVVMPKSRTAPFNDVAGRSASGALALVPHCIVPNLAAAIETLKKHEFWIYALDMQGQELHQSSFSARSAFVLGSENSGISRLCHEKSDISISIPTTGLIDSLNVSVCAGIICYEYRKQFLL